METRSLHLIEVEQRLLLSASPFDHQEGCEPDVVEICDQGFQSSCSYESDFEDKLDKFCKQFSAEIEELEKDIHRVTDESGESEEALVSTDEELVLADTGQSNVTRELVFVDQSVAGSEELLKELIGQRSDRVLEIHYISATENGIEKIGQVLDSANYVYQGIHVLSHGSEGKLLLGNAELSNDSFQKYSQQISGWSNALTEEADLLFYGCNFAGDSQGQLLLQKISDQTGADVAASTDLTGSAELGGDWELEFQIGFIETQEFSSQGYDFVLATIVGTSGADVLVGTTGSDHITGNGGNDIILSGQDLLGVGNFNGSSSLTETGVTGTNSGWTVTSSSVDFLGTDSTLLRPNDPNDANLRAIDLNDGEIQTTLTSLTAGRTYSVAFFMGADGTTTQSLDVGIDGLATSSMSVTLPSGNSLATMDWQTKVYTFTATSTSHTLRFTSTSGSPTDGPLVAGVRVADHQTDSSTTIYGNAGADAILAGAGADYIYGGDGDDYIVSGAGGDVIYGDDGDDTIYAGDGYDRIVGGMGADTIYGEGGYDDIGSGEAEDGAVDFIDGGAGDDWYFIIQNNTPDIYRDSGTDGLTDTLWLDTNANSTYFLEDNFSKTLTGIDEINFSFSSTFNGIIGSSTHGTAVNWDFTGINLDGVSQVHGGTQDDVIKVGLNSPDDPISIYGNGGNDQIIDGAGTNHIHYGGAGDDTILGDAGNDRIYGGSGTDSAIYSDFYANYTIDRTNYNGNSDSGYLTVTETVLTGTNEGSDTVYGSVEKLIFKDGVYDTVSGIFTSTSPSDIELGNPEGTNLVTNGSFETNSGVSGSANIGISSIPGWTAIGGEGFELWVNHDYVGPGSASDGQANLELNVGLSVNGIAQNITTTAGQKYVLSFDFSNRGFSSLSEVEVYWQGALIGTIQQSVVGWKTHSFVVTGSGGSDELKFLETNANNSSGAGLFDNVRMVAAGTPSISVKENQTNGSVVAYAGASDPTTDPIDTRTYSLTDNAGGRFAIDAVTGVITVANGALLDYETATSHNITVRVTDDLGGFREETFSIGVDDTDDIPTVVITEDTNDDGYVNISELSGIIDARVSLPGAAAIGDTLVVTDGTSPQNIILNSSHITNGYVDVGFASPGDGNTINLTASISAAGGFQWTSSTVVGVQIDTTAPAATISIDANITADDVINIAESSGLVPVSGTVGGNVQDGDTVTLTINGVQYNGVVSGGSFSISVDGSNLVLDPDSTIDAEVTTTDLAGNSTTANDSENYLVDVSAPSAPTATIVDDANDDQFINISEVSATVAVQVALPGDAAVGDTLTVTDGIIPVNIVLGTAQVAAGNITVSFPTPADGNSISLTAYITDQAGNVGASSQDNAQVDTTPPVSIITLDQNITADDFINLVESNGMVSITGTVGGDVQDGDTVTLTINGVQYNGVVSSGSFSIPVDGSNLILDSDFKIEAQVTTTDTAGNSSTGTDDEAYSVDITSPSAPTVTILDDLNNDQFINISEANPTVEILVALPGDAAAGDTLTVSDGLNPQSVVLSAAQVSSGSVTVNFPTPADGSTVNITAFLSDPVGNIGSTASDQALVDTTAPDAVITLGENVTENDIINAAETSGMIPIYGQVSGDVQDGDLIQLEVYGTLYQGVVQNGEFTILVSGTDLAMDSDFVIEASVKTFDAAGNETVAEDTEGYFVDLSDSENECEEMCEEEAQAPDEMEEVDQDMSDLMEFESSKEKSESTPEGFSISPSKKTEHTEKNEKQERVSEKQSVQADKVQDRREFDSSIAPIFHSNHLDLSALGEHLKAAMQAEADSFDRAFAFLMEQQFQGEEVLQEDQSVVFKERLLNYSIATGSALATVGYLLWAVRGGVLMASLFSSLPSWKLIDPLPVLDSFRDGTLGSGKDDSGIRDML